MKRTFIAVNINVSEKLKKAYDDIYQKLKLEKINWVSANNLHITLKFLGDTDEALINTITDKIALLTNQYKQFKIVLSALGVFKNLNDPRVIWIGCHNQHNMESMSNDLNKELAGLNFDIENRLFRPHLTLGRIKYIREKNQLAELITNYKDVKFQTQIIDKIVFYESILIKERIKYVALQEFYLKKD